MTSKISKKNAPARFMNMEILYAREDDSYKEEYKNTFFDDKILTGWIKRLGSVAQGQSVRFTYERSMVQFHPDPQLK